MTVCLNSTGREGYNSPFWKIVEGGNALEGAGLDAGGCPGEKHTGIQQPGALQMRSFRLLLDSDRRREMPAGFSIPMRGYGQGTPLENCNAASCSL